MLRTSLPRPKSRSAQPPVPLGLDDFPRDPIGTMRQLHALQGDVALAESSQRQAAFVFSPEGNQQVLTQPDLFHSLAVLYPGPRRSAQRRLAMSLVAANGEEYRRRRRVMLEPLKKNFLGPYLEDVVVLTRQMLDDWEIGQVRDIFQDMQQFMLRVTSGILFGLDQPQVAAEAGQMLDEFLTTDNRVGRPGMARLDSDPSMYDRLLQLADQLEEHIGRLIDYRRSSGLGRDVLSRLLQVSALQNNAVNDGELVGDVAFLFGAAHKTTASAMTWTLFLLSQHPQVARQVQQEIQRIPADDGTSEQALDQMPYLDCVLQESLRMLPPVVCMARQCAEATQLGGHALSPGSLVMLSQFITHRRPDLYENPDQFLPERWKTLQRSPYEYLPFSSGNRRCLGASFSLMVLKMSLSMILRKFRLTTVADARIDRRVTLVLEPKTELPMTLGSPRESFVSPPVVGDIHELIDLPFKERAGLRAA
jgi:cytochrome P450